MPQGQRQKTPVGFFSSSPFYKWKKRKFAWGAIYTATLLIHQIITRIRPILVLNILIPFLQDKIW